MSKKASNGENKKKKLNKKKRHYTVFPYLNYSLLYVLVSMVVVIPALIVGFNFAVNTVHKAQEVLTIDYNDYSVDNTFEAKNESNYLEDIKVGKLLGTITCSSAGINENVYYSTNRVTMQNGAGMDVNSYLPGNGGCTKIAGYSSSSFKGLHDVSLGDTIVFNTYWGKFTYNITDIYESENLKEKDGDSIALATFVSTDAFACQNGKRLYVVGELTSKEVQ